jgi:hypothetical protein
MISELFKLVAIDRMIPTLEANGLLPPGIHQASFAEVEARFGAESEVRRVQMESLRWLLDLQLVEQSDFAMLVNKFFATDRQSRPKGVVELVL